MKKVTKKVWRFILNVLRMNRIKLPNELFIILKPLRKKALRYGHDSLPDVNNLIKEYTHACNVYGDTQTNEWRTKESLLDAQLKEAVKEYNDTNYDDLYQTELKRLSKEKQLKKTKQTNNFHQQENYITRLNNQLNNIKEEIYEFRLNGTPPVRKTIFDKPIIFILSLFSFIGADMLMLYKPMIESNTFNYDIEALIYSILYAIVLSFTLKFSPEFWIKGKTKLSLTALFIGVGMTYVIIALRNEFMHISSAYIFNITNVCYFMAGLLVSTRYQMYQRWWNLNKEEETILKSLDKHTEQKSIHKDTSANIEEEFDMQAKLNAIGIIQLMKTHIATLSKELNAIRKHIKIVKHDTGNYKSYGITQIQNAFTTGKNI